MSRTSQFLANVSILILMSGCAGREAIPVVTTTGLESQMSCLAVASEIRRNNDHMLHLAQESAHINTANSIIAVVGALVFLPALFALDSNDAAPKSPSGDFM